MLSSSVRRRGSTKLGLLLGVGLAVVAVAVIGWVIYSRFYAMPGPSGKFTPAAVKVSGDVTRLASLPSGGGDGAAEVNEAMEKLLAANERIEQQRRLPGSRADAPDLFEQIDAIYGDQAKLAATRVSPYSCAALLIASAEKGSFDLSAYLPADELEWRQPSRRLRAMEYVGKAAIIEAVAAGNRGDKAKAEQIHKAVLIYGHRLANSQVRVWYQLEGLSAQARAAEALARLWQQDQPERAQAATDYRSAVNTALLSANKTFGQLCNAANKWHVGDLMLCVRKHPDPAWRVEAMLALGMTRYNRTGQAYGKQILRFTERYTSDSNPYLAAAARWAHDLDRDTQNAQTAEDY